MDKSRDHSWSTPDLCRRPNNPNLSFSDVSPNLIRPFKSGSDIGQSPSLINPFAENCNRNLTFTKDENMQEIREWNEGPLKGNAVALRSFDEKECQGTMDHLANESSPDAVENCAKNLAKDFSGEATQNLSLSASLSSNQYSEDSDETESDDDYRSVPTSSTIHLAARKISNTTRTRKMSVTGDPPPVVQSVPEVVELEAGNGTTSKVPERFSEKKCEQKSIFSFDNLVIERCTRRADGSGVASPLSNSSGDGEHALEGYDSDFRSSSSVINSYIDGVSLNSR